MKSIRKSTEFTLKERGSKFFGFLFSTPSLEEFELQFGYLKREYPDATHHCIAYRILEENLKEFQSDDGEPSGSAGLPMLNALKSEALVNIGVVVVRYYGGTKLGKPGLIEAYGETIRGCIRKADIAEIEKRLRIKVKYAYTEERDIQQIIRAHQLIEEYSQFSEKVEKIFQCPIDHEQHIISSFQQVEYKGIHFEHLGYTFVLK